MSKNLFKDYLMRRLKPSTAGKYADAVERIMLAEGLSWDELKKDISEIIALYSAGGAKEDIGKQSHSTNINALRRYEEFVKEIPEPDDYIRIGMHFYKLRDDLHIDIDDDLIFHLEDEYECIEGFGAREISKKHCGKHIEKIPVIFRPEIKKKTHTVNDEDIAKMICELFREKRCNVREEEVLEILKKKKTITDTVLGEFVSFPTPHIILYYNAIGGKTFKEKLAAFAMTLAHEYMHYMEYSYCISKGVDFYKNKKLSEAIADFFAVVYLLSSLCTGYSVAEKEKENIIEKRYNTWVKRLSYCWPYSYALYFLKIYGKAMRFSMNFSDYQAYGCLEKLSDVFENSYDAAHAFEILKA